jgi:predicted esterase YcpF (UPF0227 family)
MENPLRWTELERVIDSALRDHKKHTESGIIGYSLPGYIAAKLREKYLVIEHADKQPTR